MSTYSCLHLAPKTQGNVMFEKFDHRFKGNRYYNFFIVFAGMFFAVFLILPDEWRSPAQLLLTVFISAAIAKFSSSNIHKKQEKE